MNKDVIKFSEKSQVDKFNEKIISLTFRAELQRKMPEKFEEDILGTLTRECLNNV